MKSNGKKKIEYSEISKASINETRNVIISDCSKGGYTVAQRMDVQEGKHTNQVYLKGAIHIDDIHGLYNLRDAINMAIKVIEERDEENADWDAE